MAADNLAIMNRRFLAAVAVLALVAAACSPTNTGSDTTTTLAGSSTTTEAPAIEEAKLLSYNLETGSTFSYKVDLDQHMEFFASGDASAIGDGEIPGEGSIDIVGSATFTQTVADGAEPGTFEINIKGSFDDLNVSGSVDGEPVDEVPDFANMEPIDVTFVVDEQGNVISDGSGLEDLGGLFGDSFGPTSAGIDPGQFIGVPLPEGEVAVGDTWTTEVETPLMGEDPVVTTITSTVTATEQVDGVDVFVIDTMSATPPISMDLAELFIGLFSAFAPEGATTEEAAAFEELTSQLRFVISIDETESDATTWFDPGNGVARQFDVSAATAISMDLNVPDETTGDLVGFQMEMSVSQALSYELLDPPGA